MPTVGATGGNFFGMAADVANEGVIVSMKSHGQEARRAEGLPAAVLAEREGC